MIKNLRIHYYRPFDFVNNLNKLIQIHMLVIKAQYKLQVNLSFCYFIIASIYHSANLSKPFKYYKKDNKKDKI